MAHPRHSESITFVAYWDTDEKGPFAEVEIIEHPEWMTADTLNSITADLTAAMYKQKESKRGN